MKHLCVKKINASTVKAVDVPALLDANGVDFQPVDCVDWVADYPYAPQVQFRIAHKGDAIMIEYRVSEQTVAAVAGHDNGPVWQDSCCEFFFKPEGGDVYYNVETNCAGTVLVGCGPVREGREPAPAEVVGAIDRWSSLGREAFTERTAPQKWSMALVIPVGTAFKSNIATLDGAHMTANFYKCGDKLQTPHFLSWNRIDLPKPDFHCPAYFGTLEFER